MIRQSSQLVWFGCGRPLPSVRCLRWTCLKSPVSLTVCYTSMSEHVVPWLVGAPLGLVPTVVSRRRHLVPTVVWCSVLDLPRVV